MGRGFQDQEMSLLRGKICGENSNVVVNEKMAC